MKTKTTIWKGEMNYCPSMLNSIAILERDWERGLRALAGCSIPEVA